MGFWIPPTYLPRSLFSPYFQPSTSTYTSLPDTHHVRSIVPDTHHVIIYRAAHICLHTRALDVDFKS